MRSRGDDLTIRQHSVSDVTIKDIGNAFVACFISAKLIDGTPLAEALWVNSARCVMATHVQCTYKTLNRK